MSMRELISRRGAGAIVIAAGLLSMMVVAIQAAYAQANAAEAALTTETDKPAINVVPAEKAGFEETILVTGSLTPREEVLVSPQIEGLRIEEILVDEDDTVTAGQILAKLSDGTVKAQLD